MDCDGPKKVLTILLYLPYLLYVLYSLYLLHLLYSKVIIHDMDGSLMGLGPDASILARAEFMHQTRKDPSEYTWYSIPTKMLYDPAPLNDPGDKGWDMGPYMNYSAGVQNYVYRRRMSDVTTPNQRRRQRGDNQRHGRRRAESLERGMPAPATEAVPPAFSVEQVLDHRRRASLQSSATASDWRQRMVFYNGDERSFYQASLVTPSVRVLGDERSFYQVSAEP